MRSRRERGLRLSRCRCGLRAVFGGLCNRKDRRFFHVGRVLPTSLLRAFSKLLAGRSLSYEVCIQNAWSSSNEDQDIERGMRCFLQAYFSIRVVVFRWNTRGRHARAHTYRCLHNSKCFRSFYGDRVSQCLRQVRIVPLDFVDILRLIVMQCLREMRVVSDSRDLVSQLN